MNIESINPITFKKNISFWKSWGGDGPPAPSIGATGLLTLERRFLRADLIEVFKILGGFENLDPDRFFQVIGDGAVPEEVSFGREKVQVC